MVPREGVAAAEAMLWLLVLDFADEMAVAVCPASVEVVLVAVCPAGEPEVGLMTS